jgi:hypothetical protein
MVKASSLFLYISFISRFVTNGKCFVISANEKQISKNRIITLVGPNLADLIFVFHARFNLLKLDRHEMAFFFPFVMAYSSGKWF